MRDDKTESVEKAQPKYSSLTQLLSGLFFAPDTVPIAVAKR